MLLTKTELSLRMTYDPVADAAYIYVTDPIEPGSAVTTTVLDYNLTMASVNVDFDDKDRLLGIELLGVSRLLRPGTLPGWCSQCGNSVRWRAVYRGRIR